MQKMTPDPLIHGRARAGSAVAFDVVVDLEGGLEQKANSSSSNTLTESLRAQRAKAIEMLRDRQVDGAAAVADEFSPEMVIRTCSWSDRQKNGGPRLIVWKLRQGGVPAEDEPVNRTSQLRAVFDRFVQKHPVGSIVEPHAIFQGRRYPGDEPCPGALVVFDASYPAVEAECDVCGFVTCWTPRSMKERI